MAYDGSGNYSLPSPDFPLIPDTLADANQVNTILSDIRAALNAVVLRSGVAAMSGTLRIVSGTAATPGIRFLDETNTGLYRPVASSLAVSIAGTERLRINTGAVEVKTPLLDLLDGAGNDRLLTGLSAAGSGTYLSSVNFANNAYSPLILEGSTVTLRNAGTASLRLHSSGNVSIGGGLSDLAKLTLEGSLYIAASGSIGNIGSSSISGNYFTFRRYTGVSGAYIGFDGGAAIGGGTGNEFAIRSLDKLILTSDTGQVYVPSGAKLSVGANSGAGIGGGVDHLAVNGTIGLNSQINFTPGTNSPLEIVNRSSNGGIDFYTNAGTQRPFRIVSGAPTDTVQIDSIGGLGVGGGQAASYAARILAFGTTANNTRIGMFKSGDVASSIWSDAGSMRFGVDGAVGSTDWMSLSQFGNLYLGLTQVSTAFKLTVADSIKVAGTNAYVALGANDSGTPIYWQRSTDNAVMNTEGVLTLQGGAGHRVDYKPGGDSAYEVGFRKVVRVSTTGGTADATAVGKCYSTTGGITIPASVFVAGDVMSIFNNTASAITITQGSGLTMYGPGGATGNRTLQARGMCTIWFDSATVSKITGEIS